MADGPGSDLSSINVSVGFLDRDNEKKKMLEEDEEP